MIFCGRLWRVNWVSLYLPTMLPKTLCVISLFLLVQKSRKPVLGQTFLIVVLTSLRFDIGSPFGPLIVTSIVCVYPMRLYMLLCRHLPLIIFRLW
ncbi:unnamed protein product [Hydatigera taeniaeformis]|uniref:Secreted protein n=1 Tax=Hydatigena taeniaeformis TaxID=6205 RepID=A0A0R3WPM8_HYDTA|nr:unnamed protein product [Hydatigera taeniaeformis]